MNEIRLKKIVDDNNMDLKKLADESNVPYPTLKEWYDTSQFDSNNVGVNEITNLAAALEVEITDLIDFSNS